MPTSSDAKILAALVEYAKSHPNLKGVSAWRLLQITVDVDHILNGRNPRKLLDYSESMSDTDKLHAIPCPGCGLEPEIVRYYRRKSDKVRVGYDCTCGANVIDGVVIHMGAGR